MKHNLKRAAIVFLLFSLSTLAYLCGILDSTDYLIRDKVYTSFRPVNPKIFVIGIDSETLDQYGPWGSWSRQLTADLIEYLNSDEDTKPAVIGLDIMFSGNTTDREDGALSKAVRDGKNVVLASQAFFSSEPAYPDLGYSPKSSMIQKYEQPFDALHSAAEFGLINIFVDNDGIVRHGIYNFDFNGQELYSFSAAVAMHYAKQTGIELPKAPPLDKNGEWHIPFAAEPGEYFGTGTKGTSWIRVMNGEIPRELFDDSIVLVGPYASGMMDNFYTSCDRRTSMYGLEIHANMLQCLLEGNYKRPISAIPCLLTVFAVSTLLYIIFCRYGVRISTIATIAVCAAYLLTALALFRVGWMLPLFYPLLTFVLIYLTLLITNSIMLTIEKASLYDQMHQLFINCIRTMANAIDAKDPCTSGHCQRVAEYSLMLGRGLSCSPEDLADLEYAALLHDVGKIAVSDSILKKDGPLTTEEYNEMKTHPKRGAEILGEIKEFRGRITDGAKFHHERYDGKGYCEGLSGETIPLFGRIIAIADAYDAMTQNRPYHKRMPMEKAIEEIQRNMGTQFDPQLAAQFISMIKECPPPEEVIQEQ